jgi:DNA-binding HxlR family transcriptional regulator
METTPLRDAYLRNCPCRGLLDLVASRWTALILGALAKRPMRFGELRRRVEGITQKVLTANLRLVERDGLVRRTVHPTSPPSVEYAITDLAVSVLPHLDGLRRWSERNYDVVAAARAAYDGGADAAS